MDIVVNTQYAVPVGFVIVCAVLVFALGFKPVEEPTHEQIAIITEDRKTGKKKKVEKKPKPQSNGHIHTKDVKKEDTSIKEVKSVEVTKPVKKELVEEKVKAKGKKECIPEDFYDGDWVQAVSKKDRKLKRKDEPVEDKPQSLSSSEESTPKKHRKRGKKKAEDKSAEKISSGEEKSASEETKKKEVKKQAEPKPTKPQSPVKSTKPTDSPLKPKKPQPKSPETQPIQETQSKPEVPSKSESLFKSESPNKLKNSAKLTEPSSLPDKTSSKLPDSPVKSKATAKPNKAQTKPVETSPKPVKGVPEHASEKAKRKMPDDVDKQTEPIKKPDEQKEKAAVTTEVEKTTETMEDSKSKKKKKKKTTQQVETSAATHEISCLEQASEVLPPPEPKGNVAFDELGDLEKDTKAPKKKKKPRRD